MLNFSHIYLYFKDIIRTDFCEIYVYFMGFFGRQIDKFLIPKYNLACLLPVDRTIDRGKSRSTGPVDWRAQTCMAVWTGGPVDRAVDRPESSALWKWPRSTGRPTGRELLLSVSSPGRPGGRPEAQRSEIWPLGRSTGRSTRRAKQPFPAANGQNSFGVINTPYLWLF